MRPHLAAQLGLLLVLVAGCDGPRGAVVASLAPEASLSRIPTIPPSNGRFFRQVSVSGEANCAVTEWLVECWGKYTEPTDPWGWASLQVVDASPNGPCSINEDWYVDCRGSGIQPPGDLRAWRISRTRSYFCAVTLRDFFSPYVPSALYCSPLAPAGMPTDSDFVDISASPTFACAVRSGGSIACWGSNVAGESSPPKPNAGFTQVSTGEFRHACALRNTGSVACWGQNRFGNALPPSQGNAGFVQISAGTDHNCGVKSDSSIQCWGDFAKGQSTPTLPNSGYKQVDAGGDVSCAVRIDGSVDCWGTDNTYGSASPPPGWYAFSGFLGGLVSPPGVNGAVAGGPVIIPFSLGSNEGLNVLHAGSPQVRTCWTTSPAPPPTPATGQLVYNASSNQYLYIWQTPLAWRGTCQAIGIRFNDGTISHVLRFNFQ